jgi:hypothetical protein
MPTAKTNPIIKFMASKLKIVNLILTFPPKTDPKIC